MMHSMGSFPVVRKLGEGGMGRIYLVRDEADGSLWAAKQFKGDLTRPLFVQRFRREFRALKSLDHPAIVQVRNMEFSDENMFFLMEYVAGRSLDKVLMQPRDLGPDWINQVLNWIKFLCGPLEYIHQQRIVHRDLKPANIMILGPNNPVPLKLLDFGVIHWSHSETITTASPTFLGSLRYMAPEQMNSQTIDLRSDLYSLGIILYEAVAGRPPYTIDNPLLLMSMHQSSEPPTPRQFNIHISDALQNLILALLSKRPDDRPSSAAEVSQWIERILDGDTYLKPDPRFAVFMTGMLFSPEICGRETEMRKLISECNYAQQGQTRIVTVHGSAGIGKSRIITQIQRCPELSQRIIMHGEFQKDGPMHNGLLYALKRGRVAIRKRQLMQANGFTCHDKGIIESIDKTISILEGSISEQSVNLKMVAAQILEIMDCVAENNTKILILDDFHLAKPGDISVLKHLIQLNSLQEPLAHGLLIVLGHRDNENEITESYREFLKWLAKREIRSDIPLAPLSKIAVNHMVTSLLGGITAPSLGLSVYEESDGNPLHVIELLREMIENQPDPMWPTVSTDEPTVAAVSSNRMTHIMGRRIDRFADTARIVLHAGAVLGKYFRADELEHVCNLDDERFLDQVDLLLRQRVIEEDPFQPETYRFVHLKLHEAVYSKIPLDERFELHNRSLETLEKIHAKQPERVAERMVHHCQECSLPHKELKYLVLTSKHADAMGDPIEARVHLERAALLLETLEMNPVEKLDQRLEISVALGALLRRTGDIRNSEIRLIKTLKTAESSGHELIEAEALKQLGSIWGSQEKLDEAIDAHKRALGIFTKHTNSSKIIDCYINIGASYNTAGNFNENLHYLQLAMEKSQLSNDPKRLAMAMINIGIHYASQYQGQEALPYLNRALELTNEIEDYRLKAYSLMGLASAHMTESLYEDNIHKIIEYTNQVIDIAQKIGDTGLVLDSLYKRSIANHELGIPVMSDLDKAISMAEKLGQTRFAQVIEELMSKISNDPVGKE